MTLCSRTSISRAGFVLGWMFACAAAWPQQPVSPGVAERIKRDSARCASFADLDACDDALRWNPSDPALLVASGDALLRAQRPADAIRHYRRAAALAPHWPDLTAKISAAEKRLAAQRAALLAARRAASASAAATQRYSNAEPETLSH
jgi:hypothetical protein